MTTNSPAAAYLRGHHENLPLIFALAMSGCSDQDPVAAVRACLPAAPEEMAIGIHAKFEELIEQESCDCRFLLASGLTIQHHADALVALEGELHDAVEANPTAGVVEVSAARKMISAMLRGDPKQMDPLIGDPEKIAAVSRRANNVLTSLSRLVNARACALARAQKEAAVARLKELLMPLTDDAPVEPVEPPEETDAPVESPPTEVSANA